MTSSSFIQIIFTLEHATSVTDSSMFLDLLSSSIDSLESSSNTLTFASLTSTFSSVLSVADISSQFVIDHFAVSAFAFSDIFIFDSTAFFYLKRKKTNDDDDTSSEFLLQRYLVSHSYTDFV